MIVKSYPLNVEDTDGHYILFTIFEKPEQVYTYGFKSDSNVQQAQFVNSEIKNKSVNKLLTEKQKRLRAGFADGKHSLYKKKERTTIFAGTGKAAKPDTAVGAISIYTPKNISVSHKADYTDDQLSPVGFSLANVMETGGKVGNADGIGDGIKKLGGGIGQQLQGFFAGAGRLAGTGGAQQAVTGSVVNQNLSEVIFTGLGFRQFSFDFSFMPSNVDEAQTVDDIINMFTYYMLPRRKGNNALTYEIPAEFNLKYMYRGKENKYIHPALTLVLEDVSITYGGEKFATFRGNKFGAQPIKTDVKLIFKEVEVADRSTLYGGGAAADDSAKYAKLAEQGPSTKPHPFSSNTKGLIDQSPAGAVKGHNDLGVDILD
jgi:hypothetical protein